MNWQRLTQIILVGLTLALFAYDYFALRFGGVESTISRVIWRASNAYPGIAFMAGVLVVHLLFSQRIQ